MTSSIAKMLSFKPGTFPCCPAACEAWSSGSTAEGNVFFLFDFFFEESIGHAVFELQLSLVYGLLTITRQGPSGAVSSEKAKDILNMRKKELEPEGVKFMESRPLSLILASKDIMKESGQVITPQDAMFFGSWRALALCMHCHMCKFPDERYLQQAIPVSGIWKTFEGTMQHIIEESSPALSTDDYECLAVQSPYIFIGSERCGRKNPTILTLKRIAAYMAWWRRQSMSPTDQTKADQNRALAFELSSTKISHKTYSLLVETVQRRRSEMNPDLFSKPRSRLQNWPAGNVQDIIFTSEVASWKPIPAWIKSTGSNLISALVKPESSESSVKSLKSSFSRTNSSLTPRASRIEGHFAQVRMNGPTLNAHNELSGWSWPEFLPSLKGQARPAGDIAAGISPRIRAHHVVAQDQGMVFQPFIKLNQRDFHSSVDNATAETFHRDFAAASQQLFLRNSAPRIQIAR